MPLEFRWDVGEDEQPRAIAHLGQKRVPRRVLRLGRWLLIGLTVLAATAYAALRVRYEVARHQARRGIQAVIDAEARTFGAGDWVGYLAYQDSTAPAWMSLQTLRASPGCADAAVCPDPRFPGLCSTAHFSWDDPADGRNAVCAPASAAQIERLDLRGDQAWAVASEGDPSTLRVRFYRRTPTGWRHTAPDPAFWRDPVQLQERGILVRYHQRDEPHIGPLLEEIQVTLSELDDDLRYWPVPGRLQIDFATSTDAFQAPYVEHRGAGLDTRLVLPSPWLSGVPLDGRWSTDELQKLRYWVTYAALSARGRENLYGEVPPLLQQALLSEYGAWYLTGDPSLAPILRRILARQGEDALSSVFLSLRGGRLLGLFLARWLSLHPGHPQVFETLLAVEREALHVGQKETFLLIQDESWLAEREAFYTAVQGEVPGSLSPPQVASVDILGDLARVQLSTAPPSPLDGPTQVEDGYVYFHQRYWDWRHTGTAAATYWRPVASPTATP